MFSIFKPFIRLGLIILVVAGIAAMVAGPSRVHAAFHQVKSEVTDMIDDHIDDPVALRSQLRKLEKEYPQRIAEVRGDLADLNVQIRQIEREKAISERVVLLAEDDLASHQQNVHTTKAVNMHYSEVAAVNRAKARVSQAQQVVFTYHERAQDAERDLGYLYQQAERMESVLVQLETERTQFQAQLLQLERQVDAVARNERLIDLMEKRNKTIEEMSRYEAGSLEQIRGRLASIRTRQEAELEVLSSSQNGVTYEDRARYEIDGTDTVPTEVLEIPGGVTIGSGAEF